MQRLRFVLLLFGGLTIGAAVAALHASDPIAVYARIDRVVFAPNPQAPQTIQIFGVFSLATPGNPNDYRPPARGYLYFKLGGDEALARREWADLKEIAGTSQIVAFGNRRQLEPRLRIANEAPDAPDPYATGMGLTRVNSKTDYAPVRNLAEFRN
jgi:hypothetical protein